MVLGGFVWENVDRRKGVAFPRGGYSRSFLFTNLVNGYCAARADTVRCSTNERGDAAPSSYIAKGANMNGFISNNSMMMCMCAGMIMSPVSSPAGSARCPRMM